MYKMRVVPFHVLYRRLSTFTDKITLTLQAGHGGAGHASFTRPPNSTVVPPDGGHGGRGGDIYLSCHPSATLNLLRTIKAGDGGSGGPGLRHGKAGNDLIVPIPPGVQVLEEGVLVTEMLPGDKVLVARGGNGGRGNSALKNSKNRSPRMAESGQEGESRRLDMVLKMIADVGLVGLPNAGKSTLLRALTRAKPKVAEYPFTTLRPHVGVLPDTEVTIADIPGLIDGAHDNKGLGHDFLRHVERTRFLVYVVDLSKRDSLEDLECLKRELETYQIGLSQRKACVVGNKMDLPNSRDELNGLIDGLGNEMMIFPVSARFGRGLAGVVEYLKESVK